MGIVPKVAVGGGGWGDRRVLGVLGRGTPFGQRQCSHGLLVYNLK